MGADLITYIVAGPRKLKLSATKRKSILKEAETRMEAARIWQAETNGGVTEPIGPSTKLPKSIENLSEEELESLVGLDAEVTLNTLVALWNETVTPRDVNARTFKMGGVWTKVVVAGDMSWGDEPDGEGYQTISQAQRLGMLALLGLV